MGDRLFYYDVWAAPRHGATGLLMAASTDIISSTIPLRHVDRVESLILQVVKASDVTLGGDCRVEYALSADDETYGAYTDYDDIVASSDDFASPAGIQTYAMPGILTPFMRLRITNLDGTTNRITAKLLCRENC